MKLFEVAISQYGITEIKGEKDNPEILKYFNDLGYDGAKLKDETAWCAAYTGWCCMKAGYDYKWRLNARSFLDYGIRVVHPRAGKDIVVFWRKDINSVWGHVGIYMNEDDKYIWVLSGNQNNQVNISPYRKSRLLEFRRL